MRRAARPVMYLGVFGVVLSLAIAHAAFIGDYPFTGSSRFAWTLAYGAILCVVAYGFGLPDVPRSRQAALGPAVGAAFLGRLVDLAPPAVPGRRPAAPVRRLRLGAAAA